MAQSLVLRNLLNFTGAWAVVLALSVASFARAPVAASQDPATLYRLTLDSIGCTGASSYRALLAGQLASTSLTFGEASRDSQAAVNQWCHGQLGRHPTPSDMSYCREKYQPEMNRFLAKALIPNSYRHETASFTWRRRVSPECKLSTAGRSLIQSLAQKPETRKQLPKSLAQVPAKTQPANRSIAAQRDSDISSTISRDVPLNLPVSPEKPKILSESNNTFSENRDHDANLFERALDTASHMASAVVGAFTLPAGAKHGHCPLAAEFAEEIQNHTLLKNHPCASPSPYNESILDEIFRVHQELESMKHAFPSSTVAGNPGGGYRQGRGDGFNVQILAGDKVLFRANPNAHSYCSAAFITVFMRTVGRIDNGKIFSKMTYGQLRNFKERLNDDHGVFGTLNNDGNGIWDLNARMKDFPIGERIGKFRDPKALENACAGDMMQWDRTNSKFGHEAIFVGRAGGKAYFWSANQGTRGYGVTCESEETMYPKIIRLTHPENLAAIPEYKGNPKLQGPFRPDLRDLMLANSTPVQQPLPSGPSQTQVASGAR